MFTQGGLENMLKIMQICANDSVGYEIAARLIQIYGLDFSKFEEFQAYIEKNPKFKNSWFFNSVIKQCAVQNSKLGFALCLKYFLNNDRFDYVRLSRGFYDSLLIISSQNSENFAKTLQFLIQNCHVFTNEQIISILSSKSLPSIQKLNLIDYLISTNFEIKGKLLTQLNLLFPNLKALNIGKFNIQLKMLDTRIFKSNLQIANDSNNNDTISPFL